MLIPSIDLMNGAAVQLVGGETLSINAGDPLPIAERFSLAGEIAVIDLDAAKREGTNEMVIQRLLRVARCRVGGGIRDADAAMRWLDRGASKVILGTAAKAEVLRRIPRDRVIAALDCVNGEVVVDGWRTRTGASVLDRVRELRDDVGGFLVTFVEREGRMVGLEQDRIHEIVDAAGDARVTVAGGVRDATDIALADRCGADAQVGMALYSGALDLADAIGAPLRTDREDGLWPTVVCDPRGVALGLAYSNAESLREAVRTRSGVYWSRSRSSLWRKGETSGATQELLAIDVDCDRDALRFTVRQRGAFCHTGSLTCFGDSTGLTALERTIAAREEDAASGSYVARLLRDDALLDAKLREEAQELTAARSRDEVTHEAADVLFFALTAMRRAGVSLEDVERELDRRALRITRRPGDAKKEITP
jgi:phosphoribosyl-ATP pyrophosphohydrolase